MLKFIVKLLRALSVLCIVVGVAILLLHFVYIFSKQPNIYFGIRSIFEGLGPTESLIYFLGVAVLFSPAYFFNMLADRLEIKIKRADVSIQNNS